MARGEQTGTLWDLQHSLKQSTISTKFLWNLQPYLKNPCEFVFYFITQLCACFNIEIACQTTHHQGKLAILEDAVFTLWLWAYQAKPPHPPRVHVPRCEEPKALQGTVAFDFSQALSVHMLFTRHSKMGLCPMVWDSTLALKVWPRTGYISISQGLRANASAQPQHRFLESI